MSPKWASNAWDDRMDCATTCSCARIVYSGSGHPELSQPAFEQCILDLITEGCAPTGPTLVPFGRVSRGSHPYSQSGARGPALGG